MRKCHLAKENERNLNDVRINYEENILAFIL